MEHYDAYGLNINIEDDNLLNNDLKNRLRTEVWERDEVDAVRFIDPESCVLELGGCIGITSVVLNKKLKDPNKHVVLEPNHKLIPVMEKIRDDNNAHFNIVNSCLLTEEVDVRFSLHPHHVMAGQLGALPGWESTIKTSTTMGTLEERFALQFDTIVMDIEHGEYVLHENNFFSKEGMQNIKFLMIELHNSPHKNKLIRHLGGIFDRTMVMSDSNSEALYASSVIIYSKVGQ